MEAELIKMYVNMLNGTKDSVGTFTSGGTESIFMALVAMREYGLSMKGITQPEFIMPTTAHPAFNKACFYLGIKVVVVDVHKKNGYVCTASQYKKRINSNTIGVSFRSRKFLIVYFFQLVCSAGNYPHGNIEPIDEVSKVCLQYKIPMHVDCCLGGYSMIFAKDNGIEIPTFDFRNPAVFSVSIDQHKYGLAPKGASRK